MDEGTPRVRNPVATIADAPEIGITNDMFDEFVELTADTSVDRYAEAEEIGAIATFLASDEASFIHGEALNIDGGILSGMSEPTRGTLAAS